MSSPCTNVCVIDDKSGWCEGCGRTLVEIAGWGGAGEAAQRAILAELPGRMAQLKRQRGASRPRPRSAI